MTTFKFKFKLITKYDRKSEAKIYNNKGFNKEKYKVFLEPEGTVLRVLATSASNIGDIIVRTDNDEKPFKSLYCPSKTVVDGGFWGNQIGNYVFKTIPHVTENFIKFHIQQGTIIGFLDTIE